MKLNLKVTFIIIGGVFMNPNLSARAMGEIQEGVILALVGTSLGSPRTAPVAKIDYDQMAASQKGIQIFGTIVNGLNPNDNVVLIKTLANNQTSAKKVHSSLQLEETYLITIVAQDYMEVVVPGKRKLRLYKEGFVPVVKAKKVEEKKAPIGITGSFREDGFERDGASMKMTEEYRKKMLEKDLPKIMMQAAAEAEVDANGNVLGFRLEEIENGSMYAKAGLQDGDVIRSINGEDLNSAQGAIKTLNSLRSASSVDFEIVRGGQAIPVKLEVR